MVDNRDKYKTYLRQEADSMVDMADRSSSGPSSGNMGRDFMRTNEDARMYAEASKKYEMLGEYGLAMSTAKKAVNAKFNARWLSPGGNGLLELDLKFEQEDLERRVRSLEEKYGKPHTGGENGR